MPDVTDLGRRVKQKYPGQYDDLGDDELGRRVKAKHPGAYDDFADTPPKRDAESALLDYGSFHRAEAERQARKPGFTGNAAIGGERGYRRHIEPALNSIAEVTEGMKRGDFAPAGRMIKESALGVVRALAGPPTSPGLNAEVEAAKQRARSAGYSAAPNSMDFDPLGKAAAALDPRISAAQSKREARYRATPEGQRAARRLAELDAEAALDPSYTGKAVRGASEFLTGAAPSLGVALATRGAVLPTALTAAAQSAGNPSQMGPQAAANVLPIAPIKALRNLRGRTTAPAAVRETGRVPVGVAQAEAPITQRIPAIQSTPEYTAQRANAPTGDLPIYQSPDLPELSTGGLPSFNLRANVSPRSQGARGPAFDSEMAFDAGVSSPLSRPLQSPMQPPPPQLPWARRPQQQPLFDAAARSPWQDSVLAYYRANLLTNPVGRAADLGSTVINQFADAAARPVAAAVDVIVSKLTGKRSITGPSLRGSGQAFGSIRQGFRDAGEVMRTGRQAIDSGADGALYGDEIRSGLGKGFDVPVNGLFRMLGSLDAPFRRFGFVRNLSDRAKAAAINEARSGRIPRSQINSRAAELMDRDEIIAAAVRDGERSVLSEPNRVSSWIASQTRNSPNARLALGLVQPFMRIPLNAVLRAADFGGMGGAKVLYKIARGGVRKLKGQSFFRDLEEQRVFAQNVAAGSFAPAGFLLGAELEEQGKLEGYYYTSKNDYPSGAVPTSIEINGERYDINRLGGYILAPVFIGATFNRLKRENVEAANALLRAFSGLAQQAPALGHYGAPAKAGRILTAEEPGETIITEAGSMASGFIPASGAMGQAAKAIDPVKRREAAGLVGPVMSRIPGLRQRLPEKQERKRKK